MKIIITSLILISSLICSSNISYAKITLEMFANMTTKISDKVIKNAIKDFEKENPDIIIKYAPPDPNYDGILRTRMAVKKTPDIFSTHGWSIVRYANYLEPLNDQPWIKDLNPLIKPIITDRKRNNNIYVFPINVAVAGVVYNLDVVKEAGVNVDKIKTWDDFDKACAKIKKIKKICVQLGTQMKTGPGNYYDWVVEGYLFTENGAIKKSLLNGTFNFTTNKGSKDLFLMLNTWKQKGYLNKDIGSSNMSTWAKRMARNQAAFLLLPNGIFLEIKSYNNKANIGFFPIPSNGKVSPYLITGENITFGVAKYSSDIKKKAAKKFLRYLARPDILSKISSATGMIEGLVTAHSDTGMLAPFYKKYKNIIRPVPYFDRAYLPSGMWDSLNITVGGVLSGQMNITKALNTLQNDYNKLYK